MEQTADTTIVAPGSLVCRACWGSLFAADSFKAILASEDDQQSKGYTYTTTWEHVSASAKNGCNWCGILFDNLKENPGQIKVHITCLPEAEFTPAGSKKLSLNAGYVEGSSFFFMEFDMYTTADDNAAKFLPSLDRILQVSSTSSYHLATEKIDNCIRLHDRCPKPKVNPLPDRVVDCADPLRPKLFITNNIPHSYATLSYVWGERQTTTTTKNLDTYINPGPDPKTLPQTILDAIHSTHNLGLRYLWVDSLCIIQDSDDDKIKQLSYMRSIYHNAYVTIIAASANKVSEGFLKDRPARVPTARIPFRCPDCSVGSVALGSTGDNAVTGRYFDELEPVNGRGWCMQERFLSPRCVIFASHTMQYCCQTETVNIGNALCEPSTGRLPISVFLHDAAVEADDVNVRRAWLFVIFDYTRRSISHPSDKLVALSGIAEQFYHVWTRNNIKTEYLAGLWRHTLIQDLIWYLSMYKQEPPKEVRAPSWSWAAVDGLVITPNLEDWYKPGAYKLEECQVLECQVLLESEKTPFSAVKSGILRINGHLRGAKVARIESKGYADLFIQDSAEGEGAGEPKKVGSVNLDVLSSASGLEEAWILPVLWDQGGAFMEALVLQANPNAADKGDEGDFIGHRIGHYSRRKEDITWVVGAPKRNITIT